MIIRRRWPSAPPMRRSRRFAFCLTDRTRTPAASIALMSPWDQSIRHSYFSPSQHWRWVKVVDGFTGSPASLGSTDRRRFRPPFALWPNHDLMYSADGHIRYLPGASDMRSPSRYCTAFARVPKSTICNGESRLGMNQRPSACELGKSLTEAFGAGRAGQAGPRFGVQSRPYKRRGGSGADAARRLPFRNFRNLATNGSGVSRMK